MIKTSKKKFKENMLKQIESLKSNNSDDYWKILNKLKGKDKTQIVIILRVMFGKNISKNF